MNSKRKFVLDAELDEWRRSIENRLWHLAMEESDRGQQLRQSSRLGFVLSESEREAFLREYRLRIR